MNMLKLLCGVFIVICQTYCVEGRSQAHSRVTLGGSRSSVVSRLTAWRTDGEKSTRLTLKWRSRCLSHSQIIRLPAPWYCDDYGDDAFRPFGVQLRVSGEPAVMFVANRPSGVYDVRSPIFYRFHGGIWHRIASNPKQAEFTDRGGCYVRNGRLYAWDYEMANHRGHADPQRYWLRVFTVCQTQIHLISNRMTKHEYDSGGDYPGYHSVPSAKITRSEDPLHEFGLRWKWWGD